MTVARGAWNGAESERFIPDVKGVLTSFSSSLETPPAHWGPDSLDPSSDCGAGGWEVDGPGGNVPFGRV